MAVDNGTGCTVTFATSSITFNFTNVSYSGLERAEIETSHHGTTNFKTFIPGDLADPGELTFDIQFDPDKNYETDINRVAETITVTFPLSTGQSTASKWVGSGFIKSISWDAPMEGLMTGQIVVKWSGGITTTAST